jgi:methyl acetate hydrolase
MIDATLERARAEAGIPGVVAMAATADRVIHQTAIGSRGTAPMTLDSVGRIASMTKAIVSVTALRLVARGALTLDGPIAEVLPELAAPKILTGFDANGAPLLVPAERKMTLRHLLTHSAGFGYDTWNAELRQYIAREGLTRIPSSSNELRATPLLFEPGTRWNYGVNTDVLGLAVERAGGASLAEVVAREITAPLGMADTAFLPGAHQLERLITLGRRGPDGQITPMDAPVPSSLPFLYGGGGMFSTAPDYLRFLQAVMRGDLLPSALQAELIRPQLPASPEVGQMRSVDPRSNHVDLFAGQAMSWSLGFLVNTQPTAQGRSAFSHCWAGINNSYYWLDLTRGTCGVVMAQLLPFADPGVLGVLAAYEAAINT